MAEYIVVEPTITAPAASRRKVLVQEFLMSVLPRKYGEKSPF
jgi:hypothetical protein